VAAEFRKESGLDLLKDTLAVSRLKEAAEKAKHELSSSLESEINIPFIASDSSGPKHLVMKLSRAKLEELAKSYIDRSIEITKRAVEASPFKKEEINEIIMVGGQTRMPAIIAAVKNYFGREPNRSINPDEVVALGAAVQAGVLQGEVRDVLLLDVIPLSLGIETLGGVATKLINRNTTIPSSKTQIFSTASDNQTSVEIHIVQGEREMVADNKSLGRFILDGIPPSPRGLPQVEVTFDVDVNGILSVKALDKATARSQSIRIEASGGLAEAEIQKMTADAAAHAEEDKKKKEDVETRNTAEVLVSSAEKALAEHGAKISPATKDAIDEKIRALRESLGGQDAGTIKVRMHELSQAMQKIGEEMAKSSGNPPPTAEQK